MEKYDIEEIFRIAAVLDPRWKMGWCKEDEATEMKRIILQKGWHTLALESSSASSEGSATPSLENSPPRKKSKPFGFMQENVGVPAKECSDGLVSEVNEYLSNGTTSEEDDPLSFWRNNRHRYPVLSKLACHYLQTLDQVVQLSDCFQSLERCLDPNIAD